MKNQIKSKQRVKEFAEEVIVKKKLFTYEELIKLDLDPHHPVNVIYIDGTYAYNSTFRWVKGVYAGFSQNTGIRFEVEV